MVISLQIPAWSLWALGNLVGLLVACWWVRSLLVRRSRLWVAGRMRSRTAWDLQGVFSDKKRALAAIKGRNDFIFPVGLNQALPQETVEPPGLEFPRREH